MFHGVLVMNSFCHRRGLAADLLCSVCNSGEESLMHLLRECDTTHQIWMLVSYHSLPNYFQEVDVLVWIASNLKDGSYRKGVLENYFWRDIAGLMA